METSTSKKATTTSTVKPTLQTSNRMGKKTVAEKSKTRRRRLRGMKTLVEPCPLVTVNGEPFCLEKECKVRDIIEDWNRKHPNPEDYWKPCPPYMTYEEARKKADLVVGR